MSTPTFPVMAKDFDVTTYSIDVEDPAIKSSMDGGYVVSRPRHTRTPRQTFSFTYTFATQADMNLLRAFYLQMKGGSTIFTWLNPQDGITYFVRFTGAFSPKYVGNSVYHAWDMSIKLEQA